MNIQNSPQVEYYHEDLKQNWTGNSYSQFYSDQFGFEIHYSSTGYRLEYKNCVVHRFNNLTAAKEVSRIILNDLINVSGTFKERNKLPKKLVRTIAINASALLRSPLGIATGE